MFQSQNTLGVLMANASDASTDIFWSARNALSETVTNLVKAVEVYELTTPSHTENLEAIRSFLATIAQRAGFDETAVIEIEVAVEEACVNAIKHAHQHDATKPLRLRITIERHKLTVVVRDQGQGFNPKSLEKQNAGEVLSKPQRGGRGILMMKLLMDEVHFAFENGKGPRSGWSNTS
jgi:serine/threonine-protein kinase RsbW